MRVFYLFLLAFIAPLLAGCATKEQAAIGNIVNAGGINGGTPVYLGDITKKYRVIKKLHIKRDQIPGANYYDHFSGHAWLSTAGTEIGADAVIHAQTNRVQTNRWFFDLGIFEAKGTAVKFTK